MPRPVALREELRREVAATPEAVEEFCQAVRQWTSTLALARPFSVELLTREAVTNAALHGCRWNPAQRITCIVRSRAGRVTIAVRDQGVGFDWRAAKPELPGADSCCGRGLAIFKRYADRFRFNRRGNSLIIIERSSRQGPHD